MNNARYIDSFKTQNIVIKICKKRYKTKKRYKKGNEIIILCRILSI